ncbi:MAG: hypothetical protein FRX48_09173 [Lasallia pustulata]|uniref:Uncharacterized protein n=1 Tax=Lasallia pustulata TaxID=136370 RepID=A0A5M8PC67_9LECA|nr:MAG: hypothetical protein FRX48_09852 [Lasallia pustulata]KAA6407107.1 MAG: hypothetical protein FRX48_09173 [Lasallia pustulata]
MLSHLPKQVVHSDGHLNINLTDDNPVVLGSFNKNGIIIRRPIEYDIAGLKIQRPPGSHYPQTHGYSIKREDMDYCGDWTNALAEEEGEEEMIFKKMSLNDNWLGLS